MAAVVPKSTQTQEMINHLARAEASGLSPELMAKLRPAVEQIIVNDLATIDRVQRIQRAILSAELCGGFPEPDGSQVYETKQGLALLNRFISKVFAAAPMDFTAKEADEIAWMHGGSKESESKTAIIVRLLQSGEPLPRRIGLR